MSNIMASIAHLQISKRDFKLQKKWPAWGGVTPPNGLFALL